MIGRNVFARLTTLINNSRHRNTVALQSRFGIYNYKLMHNKVYYIRNRLYARNVRWRYVQANARYARYLEVWNDSIRSKRLQTNTQQTHTEIDGVFDRHRGWRNVFEYT